MISNPDIPFIGWKRSVGPIMLEMKYNKGSRSKEISYIKYNKKKES
jgi:hypothetical protein